MNIKCIAKNNCLYRLYKKIELANKYVGDSASKICALKKTNVYGSFDYNKILKKTTINNVGIGEFSYYLDENTYYFLDKPIVGNLSIDYSIFFKELPHNNVYQVIKKYTVRLNDPKISLSTPQNLQEALQCILFWNSLLWQTGHKLNGLGRLDLILDRFDVPENAEELLCDFLRTLHQNYKFKSNSLFGDTGQIIILGGLTEEGKYFFNDYTYLFLKCLDKCKLPDPKILLRCSANMPRDLLSIAVHLISTGIGSPLLSNDDVIISKLIDFGYEKSDAYNYAVSACWEPSVFGKSFDQNNITSIEYGNAIYQTILSEKFIDCKNIDEVFNIFKSKLKENCEHIITIIDHIEWAKDPLLSYMMGVDGDISDGGAKYNNFGLTSVGMSTAVNSLVYIKRYVFDYCKDTLENIRNAVIGNNTNKFRGICDFFGTEDDEAINFTNLIICFTESCFSDYRNKWGGKIKFGLSSPSYIDLASHVGATIDGRKSGDPFNTHISRDRSDSITEIINFESKLKFTGTSCNANVIDVMVQSSLIKDNVDKFASYIIGGIKEGIFQLQMNVLSYAQLVDAKAHPENYPNLIVRVWGFSAYFNDLPEEYKDNLIRRAKEMEKID